VPDEGQDRDDHDVGYGGCEEPHAAQTLFYDTGRSSTGGPFAAPTSTSLANSSGIERSMSPGISAQTEAEDTEARARDRRPARQERGRTPDLPLQHLRRRLVLAETGVFMLLYLDLAFEERLRGGRPTSSADLREAIIEGASHGTGADVMKRIAAPMVGGIFTSFLMEILVYPAI
jgi:hypothetical protein